MKRTRTPSHRRATPGVGVRYDETAALYTSQVVVNSHDETILLECSSGFVRGEEGEPVLPIESRLAMSTGTARTLGNLLAEVADEMDGIQIEPAMDDITQSWLRSAASLQSNLRAAVDRLPQIED